MSVDAGFVNVAKYIIKKTPIGHLGKALENLKAVVGEQVMETPDVKKEMQAYGETHLSAVKNNVTNTKVVISNLTKDPEGYYYDQGQKVRFQIGLESGAVENAEAIEFHNGLRDTIEQKLKQYIQKCYAPEVTKSNVYFNEKANKIVVLLSVHNLNLKSFWSGEWLSTWELNVKNNAINGTLRANTYYYEEGNVQFSLDTKFNGSTKGGDANAVADGLIEFIKKSENSVQLELEKVYDELSENYIKPLRRKLPVTGTKVNWNINQVAIGQQS
jgi:capping protein alpha